MSALKYVLTGVGSAIVAAGVTYGVCRHVYKKKETDLRESLSDAYGKQLSDQRTYYIKKIKGEVPATKEEIAKATEELMKPTEMTEDEAKEIIDTPDVVVYRTPDKKMRASEIAQEKVVEEYHRMYGDASIIDDCDFDPDDLPDLDEEDEFEYTGALPLLVRRAEANGDLMSFRPTYKQYQLLYFVEDVEKDADGDFQHVPVLYCEGERISDKVDDENDPYRDRVMKRAEIKEVLGHIWKDHFGDDTYDEDTDTGYDYDTNEVIVRNDKLKAYFWIQREHSMYKCAIAGLAPGDNFDYSTVR